MYQFPFHFLLLLREVGLLQQQEDRVRVLLCSDTADASLGSTASSGVSPGHTPQLPQHTLQAGRPSSNRTIVHFSYEAPALSHTCPLRSQGLSFLFHPPSVNTLLLPLSLPPFLLSPSLSPYPCPPNAPNHPSPLPPTVSPTFTLPSASPPSVGRTTSALCLRLEEADVHQDSTPVSSMRAAERGVATRGQRRQRRQVPAGGIWTAIGTWTGSAGIREGWRAVERMEEHGMGTESCWLLRDTGRLLGAPANRGQCGVWGRRDPR